ncbi:hypothetical protein CAFE_17440 [Caprobacter fermentans]|uniref:Uncharacterized protein n=1 Tax=Caproicibacter fermentans TaxID=2576756 RepID=A0A6N8HZ48_9FIRM|nr:hypothetical protein [Caproicibacter fermentans]MVB11042.1 hypothetical protein [Caproicibacter fermentans]OCN01738.1 hypothetical protein A7X67_01215 [Clostridium sp. W14A]QNK39337.1 hypothetical protein HCR03_11265 [Caproicibacter fermentans]
MLKTKLKKLSALCAAVALIATFTVSGSAKTIHVNADFHNDIDNYYDWCNTVYKPQPARAGVHVYLNPNDSGAAYVRVSSTGEEAHKNFTFNKATSSGWVNTSWVSISADYATSLDLSGTRYGPSGSKEFYDVYYE